MRKSFIACALALAVLAGAPAHAVQLRRDHG